MFLAAAVLLSSSSRFTYEFVLLGLPLLRTHPPLPSATEAQPRNRLFHLPVWAALALVTILAFSDLSSPRPQYPLSPHNLPLGVSAFLKQTRAHGNLLNHPNTGGYLQWALDGQCKIFADLELVLFNDLDIFTAGKVFSDATALGRFLNRYPVSYITVPRKLKDFPQVISGFPQFKPVFFDDLEVLYANGDHFPEIVGNYEIKAVDPFQLSIKKDDDLAPIKAELLRLQEIYRDCFEVNLTLGKIAQWSGDQNQMMVHAGLMVQSQPDHYAGYVMQGDASSAQGSYQAAVASYRKALELLEHSKDRGLQRKLWLCYSKLGWHKEAYEALRRAVPLFSGDTSPEDLYNLATLASVLGKGEEAWMFLEMALLLVSPADAELTGRINELRSRFETVVAVPPR
jgi:tetratricopeptide (TPR) repeat protein